MNRLLLQLLVLVLMPLHCSLAQNNTDSDSANTLIQLEQHCREIPNNISSYSDNLENESIKSVEFELEPGVIKHDILIKVNAGGEESYISCHQNFSTPLIDQSLFDLNFTSNLTGNEATSCRERVNSEDSANQLEEAISGLQSAADQAMCEASEQSSLGSCTKNMAYCGLENLKLTKVLNVEKPEGASCSGLLAGTVGAHADVGQCMATFIRGVFNEITDTLKMLVVDAPVWLYKKTFGRWFGEPAVEQMENVESIEAIDSSDDTDEEIELEQENPEQSFFDKVTAFTENLILEKGVEKFGCEKWSSGIPGVGKCLNPPASWECASCKQKAMALCGVAGYATGIVVETAVLATPVGVVAGTVVGLSRANKAARAAKAGREVSRSSKVAASITSGSMKIGRAGLSVITPIAKTGFQIGKKTVELLKLIPGVKSTARVLSAPVRALFRADDFLTSKAWSLSYHGTKAYSQSLAKTGNVQKAIASAKAASRVSQTQRAGNNLLQAQSEIRHQAQIASDASVSNIKRSQARKSEARLRREIQKKQQRYTKLRSSISEESLSSAHITSSSHTADLIRNMKSQDDQIAINAHRNTRIYPQAEVAVHLSIPDTKAGFQKRLDIAENKLGIVHGENSSIVERKRKAIIEAHQSGTPPYSVVDLRKKKEILLRAGFSKDEASLCIRSGICGSRSSHAQNIAKDMHTKWREGFQASNGKGAIREKALPDNALNKGEKPEEALSRLESLGYEGLRIENGTIVQNINVAADKIVPDLNMKLNGGPAKDYAAMLRGKDFSDGYVPKLGLVEDALDDIHNIWMKHNDWQKGDSPELFKPYRDLAPEEQLKDLDVLESALRSRPEDLSKADRRALKRVRENIHNELKTEKHADDIAKDMHTKWREEFQKANGEKAVREKPLPESVIKSRESLEDAAKRLSEEGYKGIRIDDEKLVQNINVGADEIVPALNMKLNGGPARDYAALLKEKEFSDGYVPKPRLVEDALDEIHNIWMKHNDWQKADNPDLFKPYKSITPEEQLKDFDVLELSLKHREPPLSSAEKKALESVRRALDKRLSNPDVITDINVFDYISGPLRSQLEGDSRFKKSLSNFLKESPNIEKDAFLTSLRRIDQISDKKVQQEWLDKINKSLNRCVKE